MSIQKRALNRIQAFRGSMLALSDEAITDKQRDVMRQVVERIDQLQRLVDASACLRESGMPSRSTFGFAALVFRADGFDVVEARVKSLRVAASAWGSRHGVRLSVTKTETGARCTRMDGPVREGAGDGVGSVARADDADEVARGLVYRPEPKSVIDEPRSAPPGERTAFHVPDDDTSLEDPQTADEVRAAMAIPEEKRTEWQQIIVDDYQHLIEFEHVQPNILDVIPCVTAKLQAELEGGDVTPRQAWIAANFAHLLGANDDQANTGEAA